MKPTPCHEIHYRAPHRGREILFFLDGAAARRALAAYAARAAAQAAAFPGATFSDTADGVAFSWRAPFGDVAWTAVLVPAFTSDHEFPAPAP